jgi:hypothetical protein
MEGRLCIAGKAAAAGIFLCPLNFNHQRQILPTFQRAISLNRTGSSNLTWTGWQSRACRLFLPRNKYLPICQVALGPKRRSLLGLLTIRLAVSIEHLR